MRRALILGLSLACGCATTTTAVVAEDANKQSDEGKTAVRCYLAGPAWRLAGYNPRGALDELMSTGPTRVIWVNPVPVTRVITADGLIYTCDREL
jgi:hypothetical protein